MTFANAAGLNVYNQYGARETGSAIGVEHGYGSQWVVKIDLSGQSIADAVAGFVPPTYLPKGALLKSAVLRVDQVFVVTGTTPTIEIGTTGSSATNGVVITEAQLEALGTTDITSTAVGTWATTGSGLPAAVKVGITLEGDTVVSAAAGKGTLILEFTVNTKI